MLSRGYEFMALIIFEENLNLSEKFSSSRQSHYSALHATWVLTLNFHEIRELF